MTDIDYKRCISLIEFEKKYVPKWHQKKLDEYEKWKKEAFDDLFRRNKRMPQKDPHGCFIIEFEKKYLPKRHQKWLDGYEKRQKEAFDDFFRRH